MFLLMVCMIMSGDNILETRLTFEDIPEDLGYLRGSTDIVVNGLGQVFSLDVGAGKVFCWDADGTFLRSFGRRGAGPGEFDFDTKWYIYYGMTILNNKLVVVNGINRTASFFRFDGTFVKSVKLGFKAVPRYIEATATNSMLVIKIQPKSQKVRPTEACLYSNDFTQLKRLAFNKGQTFVPKLSGGNVIGYHINAYAPKLVFFANPDSNLILLGDNSKPSFDIFDSNGNKIRTISFDLPQKDITAEDIESFKAKHVYQNSDFNFPDKRPYYEALFPLKNHFVVGLYDPQTNDIEGHLLNGNGDILSRLSFRVGETGLFEAFLGDLFLLREDDEGEFNLSRLSLRDKKSATN